MKHWHLQLSVLCLYGFLKSFRPIEPFMTAFQIETKNITADTLDNVVYPVWSYSYLTALIPVFLLTDLVRYKPVMIFEGLSYVASWVMMIWGMSVLSQQMVELFYGWATATEIAYYSYIYAVVPTEKYQKVTSYVRAAVQIGRSSSGIASQIIYSAMPKSEITLIYDILNYISLASVGIVFLIATFVLPNASRETKEHESNTSVAPGKACSSLAFHKARFLLTIKFQLDSFKRAYSNIFILKWSLWWSLALCGLITVANFAQALWSEIDPNVDGLYNGLAQAGSFIVSGIAVTLLQFPKVDWPKWGEPCIFLASVAQGATLIASSLIEYISVAYVCYIVYLLLYNVLITIASFNLARSLSTESYGLVFGFNTFVALALQCLITVVFVEPIGFNLTIRHQFFANGVYHLLIGLIFLVMGILNNHTAKTVQSTRTNSPEKNETESLTDLKF